MKNKLVKSLLISTLIVSGCSATGSNQRLQTKLIQAELEPEEIVSMEKEFQELKNRILKLEAKLLSVKSTSEPVILNDGWKTKKSWRKLKTGMDYESVKRILGPAHRIDGGIIADWYYDNGGQVHFYKGEVREWQEPN
jgi:ABC-type Fe3+-citrate transport system substrate-binding protein